MNKRLHHTILGRSPPLVLALVASVLMSWNANAEVTYPSWNGTFSSQNFNGAYGVYTPAVGDNGFSLYYTSSSGGAEAVRVRNAKNGTDFLVATINSGGSIYAMYLSGSTLYIAGYFTSVNGYPANNVAKQSGSTWVGLNTTLVPSAIVADGRGNVYIGTQNTTSTCDHIDNQVFLKWNPTSSSWAAVGGGMEIVGRSMAGVHCLALDSNGTNIYVGGNFVGGSGVSSSDIIKWDAVHGNWVAMGSGLSLGCFDDVDCHGNYFLNCIRDSWVNESAVSGGIIYVAGRFSSGAGIARFNTSGTQLAWGTIADSQTLAPQGNGVAYLNGVVYVSGLFDSVSGVSAYGIAQWSGTAWSAMSGGLTTASPPGGRGCGGYLATTPTSVIVYQGGYPSYDYAGIVNQQPARWQISADVK